MVAISFRSVAAAAVEEEGSARARAEEFYEALSHGRADDAREMIDSGDALAALARRYGSLEAWAARTTKNRTLMRARSLAVENVDEGSIVVRVFLLFNDGSTRHDRVGLVRRGGSWLIDARRLPGGRIHGVGH